MVSDKDTKKKQLACRASNETYSKVVSLCSGDSPAFESTSEYLLTLINRDLALRDCQNNNYRLFYSSDSSYSSEQFISTLLLALDDSTVREKILSILTQIPQK